MPSPTAPRFPGRADADTLSRVLRERVVMRTGASCSMIIRTLVRTWSVLGVLAVVAPAMAQGPPPARVRFGTAEVQTVAQRRDVTGQVRAVTYSRVASQLEGLVLSADFDPGDVVAAGQVLATLDDTFVALDLDVARRELEVAEATIGEREAEVQRAENDVQRLVDAAGGSVNPRELDDARSELAVASARLSQARAERARASVRIARLEEELTRMVVRAPFAGIVVARDTEAGEWIDVGDTVAELVNIEHVDIVLDVSQQYINALSAEGATIAVRIDAADHLVETRDFRVIAIGDELARTFPVRVRLANADGTIKPGMSAVGSIPTGGLGESLTVPRDALLRNDAGAFVYFDRGGASAVAPVDVLFAAGDRVVVRSRMLQPGTRVVIEGNERMFPGQPLLDIEAAPAAEAQAGGRDA